jgi:hypothetical protein
MTDPVGQVLQDMDDDIAKFYLENSDLDNIDAVTCEKFKISEDTLNYILYAHIATHGL